jgi:hypothetical protein
LIQYILVYCSYHCDMNITARVLACFVIDCPDFPPECGSKLWVKSQSGTKRFDGVVPFAMEGVSGKIESSQFVIRNLDASQMMFHMRSMSKARRGIEVRKHQPIRGVGQRFRIACLVVPGLKVRCLGWTDTEQDAQHFRIGDPLSQRWVEAGATLLDKRKMECRRVGDRLDVVIGGEIVIVSGNRRKPPFQQTRDCWSERVTEIGVLRAAAVFSPVTGVYGELHEIGEPSDLREHFPHCSKPDAAGNADRDHAKRHE